MLVCRPVDWDASMESLRWPQGPECPRCGCSQVSAAAGGRRECRRCRRWFSWRTETALHATKLTPQQWARAALLDDTSPRAVAERLGVSAPTARRVSTLLSAAGGDPQCRLKRLLEMPAATPRRQQPRQERPEDRLDSRCVGVPARVQALVAAMTRGERRAMNALRHRCFGATAHTVAYMSAMSVGHARRCLRGLQQRGWAQRQTQARSWGRGMLAVPIWRLAWSGDCALALGCLPRMPVRQPDPPAGSIPAEFWHNFWSGTPAGELNVNNCDHAVLVASTLIGGNDPAAACWALSELPVEALRECRGLRGFGSGATARAIDAALKARRG